MGEDNELLELCDLCPDILQEGFSAHRTGLTTSSSTQIDDWVVTSPYFSNTNFNVLSGVYTAPVTGVYSVKATISFTASAISVSLGSSIYPFFVVKKVPPGTTVYVSGLLPVVNLSLVVTVRGVLGAGTVTLSGVVELTGGDEVGLFYDDNGMTSSITISDAFWTLYRINAG